MFFRPVQICKHFGNWIHANRLHKVFNIVVFLQLINNLNNYYNYSLKELKAEYYSRMLLYMFFRPVQICEDFGHWTHANRLHKVFINIVFLNVLCNLPLFSTVVPVVTFVFLSCRPFVAITTLSTGFVGVEVTSVSWLEQLTVGV